MSLERMSLDESRMINEARAHSKKLKVPFQGIAVFKNSDTGEILGWQPPVIYENLVGRTGRELSLRKLFNLPSSLDGSDLTLFSKRAIVAFGLGTGGTPLGDPENPTAPTPADSGLNTPVPIIVTSSIASFNGVSWSSMTTLQQNNLIAPYLDVNTVVNGGITETHYNKKRFTGSPLIVTTPSPTPDDVYADDYYVKLVLTIETIDVRGTNVNELCLFSGRDTGTTGAGQYTAYAMFSRLTFPTEFFPLISSKTITLDYYIYA
jgi:hypothetical protein